MANTQTVIIDFQADFSSLETGIDALERTGKVGANLANQFRKTNTYIQKQGQDLTKTAFAAEQSNKSFTKLSQQIQQFPRSGMNKFLLDVTKQVATAGIGMDLFFKKAKEGNELVVPKFDSLRLQLLEVRKRMEAAAQISGTLSKEYLALKEQAGKLSNAIRDINSDIKNTGSDTRRIDDVVGSISALSGGFSAVQGAAALFGDTSEDLQKALLRVNAAMALATGLQQVSNALTKTGSLTRLADATATGFQVVAQKIYDATLKGSIVSLKAFKIALAATGIGLLVIGLVALISKLGGASRATKQLKKDLEDLRTGTDAAREAIQQEGEIAVALLEERGVAQSKVSRERLTQLEKEQNAEQDGLEKLFLQKKKLKDFSDATSIRQITNQIKNQKLVDEQIIVSEKNIAGIRQQLIVDTIKARTQEKEEREKAAKDAVKTEGDSLADIARKRKDASDRARELLLEDAKAAAQVRLLGAKEGSEEELAARKQLLGAELDLELNNAELTRNQKLLLADKYFKDYEQLDKDFLQRNQDRAVQSEVDLLSRSLLNRNISNENRVLLEEAVIRKTAEIEIAAAVGNAEKIKLIAAKRDQDIADAKIAMIRKTADQELALSGAQGGVAKRALESVVANEKLKSDIRINAIRQIGAIEISAIDRVIKANRDANGIIGADTKALNIEYEQLLDQKAAAAEATEKKITDITLSEGKKRQDNNIAYIQTTIAGLQSLGDILGSIQANDQQAADQAIQRKRREVDDLLEAGAITEKEARQRNKRIEAEERQAKQKAAQQQKNLAVFSAALAIPQAFIAGLTAPFPIGGPIYGAILAGIAATQAAVISARPVPKFASGKKGSYSGLAEVGEVGAELIQRADGSMEVAANRQLVYLGSRDKVFTHSETKNIMPFVNKEAISANGKHFEFDYGKMAAAVKGKSISGTTVNIDKDFVKEGVIDGLHTVSYWNRYYSSKT